jgi:hypothetical protein
MGKWKTFLYFLFRLHKFKVKQFDSNNELSPKFFFFFDENHSFKRARVEMKDIGSYDFEATLPFIERSFNESDWLTT